MSLERRDFIRAAAGALAAGATSRALFAQATSRPKYKAIAFDAFPIFDPRPIAAAAEALYPGRGGALMDAWRTRQFEYQWLRALAGRYVDFWTATDDALTFAMRQLKLTLTSEGRERLMSGYAALTVWPDVPPALDTLREAGLKIAFLSNMTERMLRAGLERANLGGTFDHVLSTDRIRSYKPAPAAYQLGVDALGLPKEEVLFVAFAGWDVAGARWFGYPTFWMNRAGSANEELQVSADGEGRDMNALVAFAAPA